MLKKLAKFGTGLATIATTFYWGALPAWADLCPTTGPKPPGCGGGEISVDKIISTVINLLLFVAFIAALVFLIIGGIKWIMSGGDKEGAGKAKETVTSALIGLVIVLAAWILINIILNFFGLKGGLTNLVFPTLEIK